MNNKKTHINLPGVLVVGSVALDDITTPIAKKRRSLGGSAVYFSWACSIFSSVSMVGVVGEDFPAGHIKMLQKRGIDIKNLKKVKGKTFHWKGSYDFDFNTANTLKTELNVFADFDPRLLSHQRRMKYLFLANIDPKIQLKVADSMEHPEIVAMDTMNFWIENSRKDLIKVLKVTDFLLINDSEARQLGEESNLIKACNRILSWGPNVVIVKQGEYGVVMFYKSRRGKKVKVFSAPAFPVKEVIDPTGAGDSFAGAFMGYIASRGYIDEDVLRLAVVAGSVVASFTVEGFSLDGLKSIGIEDIYSRFRQIKKISRFGDMEEKS